MRKFKWFPTAQERTDAKNMLGHFAPENTKLTDEDFAEMFDEIYSDIEQLPETKHRVDLQILAESPIVKIAELATNKLHENNWKTSEEMQKESDQADVELNKKWEELEKEWAETDAEIEKMLSGK